MTILDTSTPSAPAFMPVPRRALRTGVALTAFAYPPVSGLRVAVAIAVAGTTLVATLPAAADTTPLPPAPPPATQPAPPPPPPPGASSPGAYPAPPPGAYAPPSPGTYYPPPPGYYAPPGAYALKPPMRWQSVGSMAAGIVGVSSGSVLLLSAGIVAALQCNSYGIAAPSPTCGDSNTGALVGLTVAGIVLIAVGIPLIIYGARRVPVEFALVPGKSNALTLGLPQWAGAPGGAGWKWSF